MKKVEITQIRKSLRSLKAIALSSRFYSFQITSCIENEDGIASEKYVTEDICSGSELKKAMKDPFYVPDVRVIEPVGCPRSLRLRYVSPKWVADLPKRAFDKSADEILRQSYDYYAGLSETELQALIPVYLDMSANMVFDGQGLPLPVKLNCSYIYGQFRSTVYDLKNLHAHLKQERSVSGLSEIEHIPHYNNETGTEKCIYFEVFPDKDLYRKAWRMAWKSKSKYPSTLVFENYIKKLDGIGANAFKLPEEQ